MARQEIQLASAGRDVAARRQADKVAVVMMDLDKFKIINDTLGHDAGDQLLVETSKRLQNSVREGDVVARMGGDEFTLVLSGVNHISTVDKICEKIRLAIAEPFELNGNEVCSAASLGVCMYPTDSVHCKELLKYADAALYRAKASGRNCAWSSSVTCYWKKHATNSICSTIRVTIN